MIRRLVVLALLVGVAVLLEPLRVPTEGVIAPRSLFLFGILLLTADTFGEVAHDFGVPRLVGYLVAGLALGPSVSSIVPAGVLEDLGMMKRLAVGLIGLLAGAELRLADLRERYRQIFWILVLQMGLVLLVLPKQRTTEREESPPRRILTPVDSSIASAVALRTSVELARRHGARVTLLHTLHDVTRQMTFSGGGAWDLIRRLPALKEAAAERLRRKAAFFGAHDVDTEVATGLADGAILETARRSDPDLIVMGSAHRSGFDRVLLGSTLRRVLRRATVPVLLVPVVAGADTWPNEHLVDQLDSRGWTDSDGWRIAA